MEIVSWIVWVCGWLLSFVWSLVWLLLGGWVSTLAQVLAVLAGLAVWRYGWRRAPAEMMRQINYFVRFVRGWLATPVEHKAAPAVADAKTRPIEIHYKEFGDINLSTLMTLVMIAGLWALAHLSSVP